MTGSMLRRISSIRDSDWAQHGTGFQVHGARIRDWLDGEPYVFLDPALDNRGAKTTTDPTFLESVAPEGTQRIVVGLSEFSEYSRPGETSFDHSVVVVYPFDERACELLREIIVEGRVKRMLIIVWSSRYLVADMLEGLGAMNLFTGTTAPVPDPLQLAAADAMVAEQYNGLGSGRGKDAVIQLLRAFSDEGYLLDESWIRALFAAGGTFRSAESVAKFLTEMNDGVRHRVRQRFVSDIVRVLREQLGSPLDQV